MKRIILYSLFLLSLYFRGMCQEQDSIAYVKIEQFKIANITLGSSLKAALKAFGRPDSVEDSMKPMDGVDVQIYFFNGITMMISNEKVSRLECVNPKYKTPQRIKVGDRIEKLFKVLGKTEIWNYEDQDRVQYVIWPPCDTFMTFEIENGTIAKIILDFTP